MIKVSDRLKGNMLEITSASVLVTAFGLTVTVSPALAQVKNLCAAVKPKVNNHLNPCALGHNKAPDAAHGLNPKAVRKAYVGV